MESFPLPSWFRRLLGTLKREQYEPQGFFFWLFTFSFLTWLPTPPLCVWAHSEGYCSKSAWIIQEDTLLWFCSYLFWFLCPRKTTLVSTIFIYFRFLGWIWHCLILNFLHLIQLRSEWIRGTLYSNNFKENVWRNFTEFMFLIFESKILCLNAWQYFCKQI